MGTPRPSRARPRTTAVSGRHQPTHHARRNARPGVRRHRRRAGRAVARELPSWRILRDLALGPVTLHTSNSQVAVSGDEEEVVINKLLPDGLVHASEGVVGASEVASQVLQGGREGLLEVNSLLLGDSGRQTESINIATNTDTGGVDGNISTNVALDLLSVHVEGVLGISGDTVVLLDDSIEDLSEVLV